MSVSTAKTAIDGLIRSDAHLLSRQLQKLREKTFPPEARKELRRFSSPEAARLMGVSDSYLRQLSLAKEGPSPDVGPGGRRQYTLERIDGLRRHLAERAQPEKRKQYLPHRTDDEHLQIVSITNFKGGSGKTTSAVHLSQYLALRGYRVLAIDLDPQASLSSLLGFQPEYDEEQRSISKIIRSTYFHGLDVIPANLELMEFEHTTPRILAQGGGKGEEFFFSRVRTALDEVQENYDVVIIDCPPQLGFLTLSALCAATSVLVTIHAEMLDVASMNQFLLMTSDLLSVVREAGGDLRFDWFRYLATRHEPNDAPQTNMLGFLRSLFGERVLTHPALKSTAITDAGLTKQTLYEVGRENFSRNTYDRAIESMDAVNGEIENLVRRAWGRQ
jgi:chromosome partitioning protein